MVPILSRTKKNSVHIRSIRLLPFFIAFGDFTSVLFASSSHLILLVSVAFCSCSLPKYCTIEAPSVICFVWTHQSTRRRGKAYSIGVESLHWATPVFLFEILRNLGVMAVPFLHWFIGTSEYYARIIFYWSSHQRTMHDWQGEKRIVTLIFSCKGVITKVKHQVVRSPTGAFTLALFH